MDLMHAMMRDFKMEDDGFVMVPWKTTASANLVALKKIEDMPDEFSQFRHYFDQCRPKADSDVWVKMRFGGNLRPEDYTSAANSSTGWWYDNNGCKGFTSHVQDSEKTEFIGCFLYSGQFVDHERMTTEIITALNGQRRMPLNGNWHAVQKTSRISRRINH